MDDMVSRQAVLELTMQYCPDDDGTCSKAGSDIRELLDDIEHLPSAQPEVLACGEGELSAQPERTGWWIPCSERMPEDNTVCLVTVDQYYIPSYVNQVDVMIYDSGKWAFYNVDDIDTDKTCLIPIIAWMPLPEPYAERRTDDR